MTRICRSALAITALVFTALAMPIQAGPTRDMVLAGPLLNIPIAPTGSPATTLKVTVNGTVAHIKAASYAADAANIRMWTYLEMGEYVGQTARLEVTNGTSPTSDNFLALIENSNTPRALKPLYTETGRPQFHFSQKVGWNNDTNGMVYADGLYHLSWQCNPLGLGFGGWYWGHAVSRDLVHWTEMPRNIRSGGSGQTAPLHPSICLGNAFSGSTTVDVNNTLGKQVGETKTLVACFTDTGAGISSPAVPPGAGTLVGESLAYSTDGGLNYTMLRDANPIISHYGRDPKLFWYAPGQHWVITAAEQLTPSGTDNQMGFYISTNLKNWVKTSVTARVFHECPEMVELSVDGNPSNKKWLLIDATPKYQTGTFDGQTFAPDSEYLNLSGNETTRQTMMGDIKAGQCFSNAPDGRAIMMIWSRVTPTDAQAPYNQGFTLPLELTLKTASDGIRCYANPVPELTALRESTLLDVSNVAMTGTHNPAFADSALVEIELTLNLQTGAVPPDYIQVIIAGNTISYDVPTRKFNNSLVSYDPGDGKLDLRLYVDASTVEFFAEHGAVYSLNKRTTATQGTNMNGFQIVAKKSNANTGTPTIESLKVYKLKAVNSVNQAPMAAGVAVSGTPSPGTTLNGVYTFVDSLYDSEGASSYRWLRSSDGVLDAGDTVVATTRNYTMQAADAEGYLFFEVTPVATTGETTGLPAVSDAAYNRAPTATAVSVGGFVKIGQTLNGNYTYLDAESDAEGTTTFRWLRSADATLDSGDTLVATTHHYTVQAADIGQYLFFEVTPLAATGNAVLGLTGMPVVSLAASNRAPTASGVSISGISKEGQSLTGNYSYADADTDLEGTTTLRWLRSADATFDASDAVVATTRNYPVQLADVGYYLFFEVSPVAASGILTGTPVATSATALVTYGSYAGFQTTINWAGADSSPTADADGDGSSNLLEYAFGTNPVAAAEQYRPVGSTHTSNASQVLISHTFNGTGTLAGSALGTNNVAASTWYGNTAITANGALNLVSATGGVAASAYVDLGANSMVKAGGGIFDLEIVLDAVSTGSEILTGGFWSAGSNTTSHDSQGSPWWYWRAGTGEFRASTGKGYSGDIAGTATGNITTADYETFTFRLDLRNTALTGGTATLYKGTPITGTRLGTGSTPFSGDEGFRYVGIGARTFSANQAALAKIQRLTLRQILIPTLYSQGKTTQDYLELTYQENLNATDITYTVEESGDLAMWTPVTPTTEEITRIPIPNTILREVTVRRPVTGTRQFLRVVAAKQ